ncbi:MAG: Penicillinase repressor [Firmicutes bacterium]|nr:Penicillinase repressor [candidate division NPL-UPA2 bacterium]
MRTPQRISGAERQIMEFIWAAKRPVTTREILQNLPLDKTWKQSTVVTFLSRLVEKGVLTPTRISKANFYEPCLTEQEYKEHETKLFIEDVHKGSFLGFFAAMCDSGALTSADIAALMQRIKDR